VKTIKDKRLVKAWLEQGGKGVLFASWDDPRKPCPSMKYPITDVIFGALVEQFRSEGMTVLVNLFGKEIRLNPHHGMIQ